ncbi:heme A synthase [uncultured Prochlorococcus sp.]|uniref:COX15/CtaA family protein n=1 Tax=uncultured Prochlorococcus sp. TaxID=159733 RepID=UPI00258B45AA|nr:COX15/CtaA family protein [uncultured Prochlorococcus sp.]
MINNQLYQSKYLPIFKRLGNHSVFALIALIVIGGATRVMEAGLACPDWPLCYGSFLPLSHMNLRVFLEWFHRLDAFLIGLLILSKFALSIVWKSEIPNWLPKTYSLLLFLVMVQGSFGALTVINLLDSYTVTGHLLIAFLLLITTISINQNLENNEIKESITWWRLLLFVPLILTLIQSFIGVRLSSTWSAHICLSLNKQCLILDTHKLFAFPITVSILSIIAVSFYKKSLFIKNWKYLTALVFLLISQIVLGVLSLKTNLNEPIFIIGHQLNASLLIAILTTLIFRNPFFKKDFNQSPISQIVGINS